jgi:hypothetical protein
MAAHDYEDTHDIEDLDDRELRDLVREHLAAHPALDIDDITVTVRDGTITLSGRVGTDGEKRIAEHVITDTLGIVEFNNDLMVDVLARAESPAAIDDHLADEEQRSGVLLGDAPEPQDPEAEYYADRAEDDIAGTVDYEKAMGEGMTWNPPEGPTPEGMRGSDAGPEDYGERH